MVTKRVLGVVTVAAEAVAVVTQAAEVAEAATHVIKRLKFVRESAMPLMMMPLMLTSSRATHLTTDNAIALFSRTAPTSPFLKSQRSQFHPSHPVVATATTHAKTSVLFTRFSLT